MRLPLLVGQGLKARMMRTVGSTRCNSTRMVLNYFTVEFLMCSDRGTATRRVLELFRQCW